ncbi:NADP-dependent oxidoreductase [Rhodococcus sp. NCIMB 12038]|uniref:NADP-dependent oxidoreductase n=1 Tax=Rhodococcus sp. NCIMB 12038 TaxID=933800 RepID=UPI000B3C4F20|nr:NADP-dependent oxidoreductase [Rhodococcus sp. NCIMB 12038]OUS92111.1 hypothetical protein CA951_29830 [Rhodococcus sp. NCIMB 12038]
MTGCSGSSTATVRPNKWQEIRLVSYPVGEPHDGNFALVEVEAPDLEVGEYLVSNEWISLDPAQRLRMNPNSAGYLPPFRLGEVPASWAVGRVVSSRNPSVAVGACVLHNSGWSECAVLNGCESRPPRLIDRHPALRSVDFLGPLGWPGLTAYAGLFDVGRAQPGETVFVSAAAGAVGGMVVQLAKARGLRVVASVGTREKADLVGREYGADAVVCYRDGDIRELLPRVAGNGIDIYFDNVGGDHLEAALASMRPYGRIVLCGSIASYNDSEAGRAPANLFLATAKGLILHGFLARMYEHRWDEFSDHMRTLVERGQMKAPMTVVEGLEAIPQGFRKLFSGGNVGKMVVRIGQ